MPLNRRIVLEGPLSVSAEPQTLRFAGIQPKYSARRKVWEPEIGFKEFFEQTGIPITKSYIRCTSCSEIADFDADFESRWIKCLSCGRSITFEQFQKEQS